jgi:hypothetical protein
MIGAAPGPRGLAAGDQACAGLGRGGAGLLPTVLGALLGPPDQPQPGKRAGQDDAGGAEQGDRHVHQAHLPHVPAGTPHRHPWAGAGLRRYPGGRRRLGHVSQWVPDAPHRVHNSLQRAGPGRSHFRGRGAREVLYAADCLITGCSRRGCWSIVFPA